MDGHQAHGVDRIDCRIRFVPDRQPIEMVGNARERLITPVLSAPDHRAEFLEVLARLEAPTPAKLVGVRALAQHLGE